MKRLLVLFPLVALIFFSFSSCSFKKQTTEEIIKGKATEVLSALKSKDMVKLSKMIHPDKGIRFSPYSYVDINKDIVFNSAEIKTAFTDRKVYTWGSYDGSGDPISLTFSDYYKKFIYDVDFLNAKETGYNKILGQGTTTNNSIDVYPGSNIVEYYFPGFDPKYQGIDWKSLRLVFEKKGSTWYLVGIIHAQWTI